MSYPSEEKLNLILAALTSLKQELNDLRTDFRAHDHGSTYTQQTVRLGASAGTFSGTAEASAAVSASIPSELYKP
jgi:hypothetical protein